MSPDIGNPSYLASLLTTGLTSGVLYAFVALTIVLVFKTTGHINLAQGEMGALGAFVVLTLTRHGIPVWGAIAVSVAASFAFGAGIERGLIRPLERRGVLPVVLATLALFLIINSVMAIGWGTQPVSAPKPLPSGLDAKITILDGHPPFYVTYAAAGTAAILLVTLLVLWLLMERTKLGLGYRAVAANKEAARTLGIPVGRMQALGWGIAAAIGTLAAVLVAESVRTIDYNVMGAILIFGLAAATVGGFDSIAGAVAGGLALGLVVTLVPGLFTVVQGDLSLLIALVAVLLVLLVRPQGLFGTKPLERV